MLSQSGPIYSGTLGEGGGGLCTMAAAALPTRTFAFINGARFVSGVETRAGARRAAQTGTRPPRPHLSLFQSSCKCVGLLGFTVIIFFPANIFCVVFFFFSFQQLIMK